MLLGKESTAGETTSSVDVAGRGNRRQAPDWGNIVLHAYDDKSSDTDLLQEGEDGGGQEGSEESDPC